MWTRPAAAAVTVMGNCRVVFAIPIPAAVMTTVSVATVAEPLTRKVTVVESLNVLSGLNVTVMPVGAVAEKFTVPVNASRVIASVIVAESPCTMLRDGGCALKVMPAGSGTISRTMVVSDTPAPDAVTVRLYVPGSATTEPLAIFSCTLSPTVEEGEKVAVTPVGAPLTAKDTLSVKFVRAIAMELDTVPATSSDKESGDAEIVIDGGTGMCTTILVVVSEIPVPDPVIVTG